MAGSAHQGPDHRHRRGAGSIRTRSAACGCAPRWPATCAGCARSTSPPDRVLITQGVASAVDELCAPPAGRRSRAGRGGGPELAPVARDRPAARVGRGPDRRGRRGPADGAPHRTGPAGTGRRGVHHADPPVPHRRGDVGRSSPRAARLGARPRRLDRRGRLRRRVPLRPPPRGRDGLPRAGPRRLSGIGQQDALALAASGLARGTPRAAGNPGRAADRHRSGPAARPAGAGRPGHLRSLRPPPAPDAPALSAPPPGASRRTGAAHAGPPGRGDGRRPARAVAAARVERRGRPCSAAVPPPASPSSACPGAAQRRAAPGLVLGCANLPERRADDVARALAAALVADAPA